MKIETLITTIDRNIVFPVGDVISGGSYLSDSKIKSIEQRCTDWNSAYYSVNLENGNEIIVPFESAIAVWSEQVE